MNFIALAAAFGLLVFLAEKRRRRLDLERLEVIRWRLGILPERPDDGRVHCCRCGGPIAPGDVIVAGPPTRDGHQTAHFDCPLTPIRPRGLPFDKRWRESYDRDTARLLHAFTSPRMEDSRPRRAHGLEADHSCSIRTIPPMPTGEGNP